MPVSINPKNFVEGGAVPIDKELTWKETRFAIFDYTRKDGSIAATTTAIRVTYVDKDGTEHIQHYSIASPDRFVPSEDGKILVAVGSAAALNTSSNGYLLLNALINAGFPEDKLGEDISLLDGLVTFNIGVPEPKRSGLKRPETDKDNNRERVLSMPSQIIKLPWEKPGKAAAAKKDTKTAAAPANDDALAEAAIAIVEALLEKNDSCTRKEVATQAVRAKKPDVAKFALTDGFAVALIEAGLNLDGETISRG